MSGKNVSKLNNDRSEENDVETDDRVTSVLTTVVLFSLAMFIAPLSTYYLTKSYIFEGYFEMENSSSSIYSAIMAVVVVHLVAGSYVLLAWKDAMSKPKED